MGVSAAHRERRSGLGLEPLDVEAAALAASVAVMAPALTEGGPQKPENLLPSLAASGFLSAEQATQVCQNRKILTKFVVPANDQPSKIDDQCLRGVPKDLIRDVINSKYANDLDSLSAFANASDLIARNGLAEQDFEWPVVPEDPVRQVTDIIMNDPSMGDQTNNMGFLKSSTDLPLVATETAGDNKNLDVDQIIGFGTDIAADSEQCNMANVADIGHNVEEILQVIKSIEGAADSAENISASGSEPVQSAVDGVEMFAMPEEGFASFERDLLNDVDVMSLCNDNINIPDTVDQQKSNGLRLQQDIVAQKQFESERRSAFLLRRLRKLQARIMGKHVAEETTGVLELAHHGVKKYFFQELVNISSKSNVKNFPEISSNLHSFLQKIGKMCIAQSNSVNRQRVCRYFGGGSRDNLSSTSGNNGNRQPVFGMPQVKLNGEEVESVAGPLSTQLHVVESNLDSDCTASSSGGESCDEMQTFNNPHQQHLSM